MNKKGQVGVVGIILITFITIIVGVILFQAIAQQIGDITNTVAVANTSLSTVANDTVQYMLTIRALSGVVMYNATNDAEIDSSYWTVTDNVIHPTTGNLCVSVTPGSVHENYTSAWQISGTAQPLTYLPDSASRSMAGIILIFFALAIAVVALIPTLRSEVLGALGNIGR